MALNDSREHVPGDDLAGAPHVLSSDDLAVRLDVRTASGLSHEQVRERTERYGPNRLPEAPPRSAWRVFLPSFKSILILILMGAALLAALVGNGKDAW